MSVYAIVVTYNPDLTLLKKQKESLTKQVDHIVYVDNGSDGITLDAQLKSDKSSFIYNKKNDGLAKAQNIGIEIARSYQADYIVLFDQDSVPPDDFIINILACYHDYRNYYRIGLIGPAIRNMFKQENGNEQGVQFNGISLHKVDIGDFTEVSFCIASGSFIPLYVLNKIGSMEEKLFIDGLDIEWCFRSQYYGYKVFQTNRTFLDHCLGDGSDKKVLSHSPQREYYIVRNAIWMIKKKYIPLGYRIRKTFSPFGRLVYSIGSMNINYIKADIKGIWDGIRL